MLEWGRKSEGVTPVLGDDDSIVARVRPAAMAGDAQVDIGGANWLFFANRGELVGERSGAAGPALRARRPGRSRRVWDVHADKTPYRVEPSGHGSRRFVVRRDGSDIGTGSGASRLRRPTLDIGVEMPLEHQVFLLWLIGSKHRRASKSGRGGGTPIPGSSQYGAGFGGADGMDGGAPT